MTKFITIREKGESIIIDNEHYDGKGDISNLGNWMIDYIDNFNFVNRGDKQRKISISLGHGFQGSLACFIRNSKLEIIQETVQNTIICRDSFPIDHEDHINGGIDDQLSYDLIVEPHSVAQIYLEYVNLANSYGNVTHFVYLNGIDSDYNSGYNFGNILFYILLLIVFILV